MRGIYDEILHVKNKSISATITTVHASYLKRRRKCLWFLVIVL